MIVRGADGILVQHDIYQPDYPDYTNHQHKLDGGDSARSTGILALCGSEIDKKLAGLFFIKYKPVRHPYEEKWNKPEQMSRDQLICLASAFVGTQFILFNPIYNWLKRHQSFFLNKDILMPSHWGHLYRCADFDIPKKWHWLSELWLFFDILWSTTLGRKEEQNQIICMVLVRKGWALDLYLKMYQTNRLTENLKKYWCEWRDQSEVAELMLAKLTHHD